MERKIRILMAKPGLDGHDRGIKVLAAAYRDAGMEVIYLGLRQTPEKIVYSALQEDVDGIALSSLNNAHMTIFPNVLNLMKDKGLDDVLLVGGGIIPKKDIAKLKVLYSNPDTIPKEIKKQVTKEIKEKKTEIKSMYQAPKATFTFERIAKWSSVQVVKAILGMPIIPGR